jgi:hypothetical protein
MAELGFFSYRTNDDTSDNGPRTASVLTFSGNTNDSFVKELTQNSLDARMTRNGNLKIVVKSMVLSKREIPNFQQFESSLNQMEKYWNSKSDQYKRFFQTSKNSISGNYLNVLVFEDYLTNGLQGNDYEGTFKNCVNDENVSGKEYGDSLGNHGIGKNSIFGYSGIHTVYYSSLNKSGEYKFKGVSKLGNYKDESNVKRSDRIYYGDVEGETVRLLNDPDRIPNCFKRQEIGLSQFVIGAELNNQWQLNVKKAFISNYWFLLEIGKLEVNIQGDVLNKLNYHQIATDLFNEDNTRDNPLPFIKSFKEVQIHRTKEIFKIGLVNLYIREAEDCDNFPDRIVFLRDGMKIKHDPLRISGLPVSVAGVVFCDNPIGNTILGAMEPHAHDKFLPELVEKKQVSNVSVADAKKIINEIEAFKKTTLEELRRKYIEEGDSVDIVDDLFSAMLGFGKGSGAGITANSNEEAFNRRIFQVDYNGVFSSNSRNSIIDNSDEVYQGDGDGPGVGPGSGGRGVRGGSGAKKSELGGASQSDNKSKGKIEMNLKSRFFISETKNNLNTYKMVLRSEVDYISFDVIITQYGDSGRKDGEMTSRLKSVIHNGQHLDFNEVKNKKGQITGYQIKSLSIDKDYPSIYDVQLEEKSISALQIIDAK